MLHIMLLPLGVQVTSYPFGKTSAPALGAIDGVAMTTPNRQAAPARIAKHFGTRIFMPNPPSICTEQFRRWTDL
jgi:hypothetical protein